MTSPNVEAPGVVGTGRAHEAQHNTTIVAPGRLPPRKATACAEVLCRLLSGMIMSGMDGVFDAGTTRLAAQIHYLQSKHGWLFEKRYKVNGCNDGRVVTIVEYWLAPVVIADANTVGAAEWCKAVRIARAALRARASQTKLLTAKANAAAALRRRAVAAPGQVDMFQVTP